MASRLTQQIDGEGAAWAAGGFAASILVGILIEPFRGTVGLENVVMIYLLVVVLTAAVGGRAAGLLTALSAALSYDFFLTTPYHTLVIDTLAQVVTVALLLATGLVASLAGRARRRLAIDARQQAEALRLLNTIAQAVAIGGAGGDGSDADQAAAEGLRDLLGARRVLVRRSGPTGVAVVADIASGDDSVDMFEAAEVAAIAGRGEAVDLLGLPRLDEQGRLPHGFRLWRNGRPPRPPRGAAADLVRGRQRVGELIVVMDEARTLPPAARLTVVTVAHLLAAMPAHIPTAYQLRPELGLLGQRHGQRSALSQPAPDHHPAEAVAARCCPWEDPSRRCGRRSVHLPSAWLTRPPAIAGSRSAFPLQSESRCSPGVSCRRARWHAGPGPSTAPPAGLWTALGTTRVVLLTAG